MFEEAVKFVLEAEGGLVDDPRDPGGLTNFGISIKAFPNVDIRNLTVDTATAIYKKEYWDKCKCDQLPGPVAFLVFDAAVNQGAGAAARALQAALGVGVDGVIGTNTIAAAQGKDATGLAAEVVARRIVAYGNDPKFATYGLGWSRRLARAHQLALQGA